MTRAEKIQFLALWLLVMIAIGGVGFCAYLSLTDCACAN